MRYKRVLLGVTLVAAVVACDDVMGGSGDITVGGGGFVFSPSTLTLTTKRPVKFVWGSGPHNVTWEDMATGSGDKSGGEYTRDFTSAAGGDYRFRCTIHSTSFTVGMVGRITVPAP